MTDLETLLGYEFKDKGLLTLALTHPSYLGNQILTVPKTQLSNQRLEFLGDSIIGLVFAVYLMDRFPHAGEGHLTQTRSQFVCGKSLTEIGKKLGLVNDLLVEKSYRVTEKDIADTVEALIGAVYQDGGLLNAEQVILNIFAEYLDSGKIPDAFVDHKSNLQKLVHKFYKQAEPVYTVEECNAQYKFKCQIFVKNDKISVGFGDSKKKAEVAAAEWGCKVLLGEADV